MSAVCSNKVSAGGHWHTIGDRGAAALAVNLFLTVLALGDGKLQHRRLR